MAKVYKATIYISDYNSEIDGLEDLEELIDSRLGVWMRVHVAETKESEEFEFEDDLEINKTNATTEDFEEYVKD